MRILGKLSLRARLALLYAVLLVFSVVLVGSYSYWNIWQLFINTKSSHLRARAKPIIEHWLINYGFDESDTPESKLNAQNALALARDLTSRDAAALVLNKQGQIIANGKRLPEEPEAPAPQKPYYQKALSGENEVTYRSQANGKPVLVLLIPLRPRPASPQVFGVIQMSTMLTDINQILFRHGAMLVSLVAVILILGIAAGFWSINISLKDLYTLVTACNEISKGNFSERAPVENPRDEIGRLAISFNQMIDRIETMFASQRRFSANAAHELLTPLTGLRGSLEVLLRGVQDDPTATARLTKGMYKEVNRLIRLCNQLLGLSRLETPTHVRRQPIVLSEFINDLKRQAQVLAPDRSLVIHQGPYAKIYADPDFLKQIMLNLLSNALRYSPPDKPVIINWKLLADQVVIQVSDQGRGMDPQTLSRVFEPFYQGKSTGGSADRGTGLGLTLARTMVEAHDGNIWLQSEPGKGTTVYFTLPIQ